MDDLLEAMEEEKGRASLDMRSGDAAASKGDTNVRVVIRVRPPLEHELNAYLGIPYKPTTRVDATSHNISLVDGQGKDDRTFNHSFTFDHIYDQGASQREVYDSTAKTLVASCLEGYNATILAYGQTGTGKTYTMEGAAESFEDRGIVPRAIEQIFSYIQEEASAHKRFLVRASYLQIYNDVIYDLLKPSNTSGLQIREDDKNKHQSKGVYVEGLSEWVVRSPQEITKLMAAGASLRATGKTKLNEVSSRSHAILKLILEQCETSFVNAKGSEISFEQFESMVRADAFPEGKSPEEFIQQHFKVGKLNLVDLAGSERVRVSGATGVRLEESRKINRSLSALGNVISALTDVKSRQHIPYRDSKLTRILEDSLGGNCKTAMIAMVSPATDAFMETLSTLKFANRAKNVRNNAHVNEDVDRNSLLRKYERELKRLRKELFQRSKNVVDQRVVLELEDQKRRAEADKIAALRALESRSFQFMKEKQEKRKLEERISELESQMLVGGHLNGDQLKETPQFRMEVNAHRDQIRAEYNEKLEEMERERELIEAQKAQVGRYKQLLLKQRDIMVALTQRLNERDEQIVTLQDELDECERARTETEERLDQKTTELIHLQRITMEKVESSPQLTEALGFQTSVDEDEVRRLREELADLKSQNREGAAQVGLESRVRALTSQYQTFRDEMTDRVAKKDLDIRTLREENVRLKTMLQKRSNSPMDGDDSDENSSEDEHDLLAEMGRLRLRSLNHAKEQVAMRTIMEKINVLVLNIQSVAESESDPALPHVRALSNLVSASVNALTPSN
mmetsp:Transcript_5285/g.9374  ORF Transcript_5285/g.9374 Transcript_5285/m.9374 type:complete len:798 (-) Transcript_5285:510-2903(-)